MKIEVKLLREGAKFPKYAKDLDAGADIFLPEDVVLQKGINKVPLGISIGIPQGFEGQIRPRSGCVLNNIYIHNPPIDAGYTGEIHAFVEYDGKEETMLCKANSRICQLVIAPVIRADFVQNIVNDRGENGFNSTGI